MNIKITFLADHPEHLALLAEALYLQFGYLVPDRTLKDFKGALLLHCQREKLPVAFIALDGEELLGSYSLRPNDLASHPHLTPWLGSVYVMPHHRNQGIGKKLVAHAEKMALDWGFGELHLFTPDREQWYRQQKWETQENTLFQQHPISVMKKVLV